MLPRRPTFPTLAAATIGLAVVTALFASSGSVARAQGHTPDPYNIVGEGNSQYEPYMYASQPSQEGTIPNQTRMQGRPSGLASANRFQNYAESLDGVDSPDFNPGTALRRRGAGTPYYSAYRQYDQTFDRLYRPNKDVDTNYNNDKSERTRKYFEAMRETDPKKRSVLLREFNLENMKATRDLSSARLTPDRERPVAATSPSGARPADRTGRTSAPGLFRNNNRTSAPLPGSSASLTGPVKPRARTGGVGSTVPSPTPRPEGTRSAVKPRARGLTAPRPDSDDPDELLNRATRALAPRPPGSRAPAPPRR